MWNNRFQHLVSINLAEAGHSHAGDRNDDDDQIVICETTGTEESNSRSSESCLTRGTIVSTTPERAERKRVIKPKAPRELAEVYHHSSKSSSTKSMEKKLKSPQDGKLTRKAFRRKTITRTLITFPNGFDNPPEFTQVIEPHFIVEQYRVTLFTEPEDAPPQRSVETIRAVEPRKPTAATKKMRKSRLPTATDLDMIEMLIRTAHIAKESMEIRL